MAGLADEVGEGGAAEESQGHPGSVGEIPRSQGQEPFDEKAGAGRVVQGRPPLQAGAEDGYSVVGRDGLGHGPGVPGTGRVKDTAFFGGGQEGRRAVRRRHDGAVEGAQVEGGQIEGRIAQIETRRGKGLTLAHEKPPSRKTVPQGPGLVEIGHGQEAAAAELEKGDDRRRRPQQIDDEPAVGLGQNLPRRKDDVETGHGSQTSPLSLFPALSGHRARVNPLQGGLPLEELLSNLRAAIREKADEGTAEGARRYFKEAICLYGVKTADVSAIARKFFRSVEPKTKQEIFSLCDELWRSGFMEESFVACHWAYALRERYAEGDLDLFERWLENHVSNWASCDTLCNHTLGAYFTAFPHRTETLLDWTRSPNRWVRRASAVSLIIPARKGQFEKEVFAVAERLLLDEDDLVRKGYGWLLKVTCAEHEDDVFRYVLARKDVMPRTALRYAIEKMSPERRREAMGK